MKTDQWIINVDSLLLFSQISLNKNVVNKHDLAVTFHLITTVQPSPLITDKTKSINIDLFIKFYI